MTRTGNHELDAVLEAFLREPMGDWTTDNAPIEALRDPVLAHGMCQMVSEQFVEYAKRHGFKAYATETDMDELGYEVTGAAHGEVLDADGEIVCGHYHDHTIVTIVLDDPAYRYGREFYIDWTASQYGYSEHPKVTT